MKKKGKQLEDTVNKSKRKSPTKNPKLIIAPSKEVQVDAKRISIMAKHGLDNDSISEAFGVTVHCFMDFLKKNPEIMKTLKEDKEKANNNVEAALYSRALGYEHFETKVFYNSVLDKIVTKEVRKVYPPDVTACIFWLKNRLPDKWRELQEFSGQFNHDVSLTPNEVSDEHKRRVESNVRIIQRYAALDKGSTQN
jgi:hypothetical protein